jgi:hypothetical protein
MVDGNRADGEMPGRREEIRPIPALRALPGAGERASSTEMIIDNIAGYAVWRSHNVVGLPIGKSRVEADPQVLVRQCDGDASRAALPESHQPNAVEPQDRLFQPRSDREPIQDRQFSLAPAHRFKPGQVLIA